MSVSACNIIEVEYSGEETGLLRNYDVTFEVITSTKSDHARVVYLYLIGYNPPGSPYSLDNDSDPFCWARRPTSIRLRSVEKNRKVWRAKQRWSNAPMDREDQESENPLDDPPIWSGSFVRATRAATKDRNGNLLANSAGEPWLPAPEYDDSRDTIIVEFNTATIDLALRSQMRDTVNDATHWNLAKRTLKLGQWSINQAYYGDGIPYVKNRIEIEVNGNKWDEIRLDEGFRIKTGVDGSGNTIYQTLMDSKDQPLREPRLLDGAGALLPDGGAEVEITKEILEEADFSTLPIPGTPFNV